MMGTVHPRFLPGFLFPCDHRRVIRSRERGNRKRHKRKRNDSFQDGEWIIQIHLDLHMTDVILRKTGKPNHTLNAQGNRGYFKESSIEAFWEKNHQHEDRLLALV